MVDKIWEDKWEYESFTYFVGNPLLVENERNAQEGESIQNTIDD